MRKSDENMNNIIHINQETEHKYTAGPLNLNMQTRQADTVMGAQLSLSINEFDTLYMLVTREGEYLSFDELYQAVWENSENPQSKEDARASIDELLMKVGSDGEGFMWIEYLPEAGYRFKTHWGDNWGSKEMAEAPSVPTLPDDLPPAASLRMRKLSLAVKLAGIGMLTAVVILMMLFLFRSPVLNPPDAEPIHVELEDPNIPLATPNIDDTG